MRRGGSPPAFVDEVVLSAHDPTSAGEHGLGSAASAPGVAGQVGQGFVIRVPGVDGLDLAVLRGE